MNTLSTPERKQLSKLEATIEKGLSVFMEVGEALMAIRSEQLYIEQADTFEKYVAKRFGFSRRWAYQLIESTAAAKDVKGLEIELETDDGVCTMVHIEAPNERQARELAKVAKSQDRAKVMETAVRSAKVKDGVPQVTASLIKKAAQKLGLAAKPEPKPEPAVTHQPELIQPETECQTCPMCNGTGKIEAPKTNGAGFDGFWKTILGANGVNARLKSGKGAAEKAYKSALNRLKDEGIKSPGGFINARMIEYAVSDHAKGDYCWQASTWLNAGHYHDEPEVWQAPERQNGRYVNPF